jgi:hypothetical protein
VNNDIENEEPWEAALAEKLPGQLVLVGLAYFDVDSETPFEQQQLFGRVVFADAREGIVLSLQGRRAGERFCLPLIYGHSAKRPPESIAFDQPAKLL